MLGKEQRAQKRPLQKSRQINRAGSSKVSILSVWPLVKAKFDLSSGSHIQFIIWPTLAQIYQIYFFGAILCANLQISYL